jgi:hypothetical protein
MPAVSAALQKFRRRAVRKAQKALAGWFFQRFRFSGFYPVQAGGTPVEGVASNLRHLQLDW